jgi:hypothetical protein
MVHANMFYSLSKPRQELEPNIRFAEAIVYFIIFAPLKKAL